MWCVVFLLFCGCDLLFGCVADLRVFFCCVVGLFGLVMLLCRCVVVRLICCCVVVLLCCVDELFVCLFNRVDVLVCCWFVAWLRC